MAENDSNQPKRRLSFPFGGVNARDGVHPMRSDSTFRSIKSQQGSGLERVSELRRKGAEAGGKALFRLRILGK